MPVSSPPRPKPLPNRPTRVVLRQASAKPIFHDLEASRYAQRPKTSGKSPLAQDIRYALGRTPKARPYLENGHLELGNNTAERGGKAMTIAVTLIETAKLGDVDPPEWLT